METVSHSLYANLTEAKPYSSDQVNYYLSILQKLLESCKHLPIEKSKILVIGASHDIIRKARLGTIFPFYNPEFLKIVQAMVSYMSPEAIIAFSHIFPEEIQELLKPKSPSEIRQDQIKQSIAQAQEKVRIQYEKKKDISLSKNDLVSLETLIQDIQKHFTIKDLLALFHIVSSHDEKNDRELLSPYFLLLQEAIYDFDPQAKKISQTGNFRLICQLRGFVLLYYRMGASLADAFTLYLKLSPDKLGEAAGYAATIHFGNFINGLKEIIFHLKKTVDSAFIQQIFLIADAEGAYTLPLTLESMILPSAVPIPSLIPVAHIISSQIQLSEDHKKFGQHILKTNRNKINIDI